MFFLRKFTPADRRDGSDDTVVSQGNGVPCGLWVRV